MKHPVSVLILEFLAVFFSVTATFLAFGTAAAFYAVAAWALLFAYVLTPRRKRPGDQAGR